VRHDEGAIEHAMHEDRAPGVARTLLTARELKREILEAHDAVLADDALVLLREHELEVHPDKGHEGRAALGGLDGEASVEVGHEDALEVLVRARVIRDSGDTELLR
jgi:hypothetical protein